MLIPDREAWFVADPARVERMLSVVLANAAKYSGPGRAIDLAASVAGGAVGFRARDEGDGIRAEMLPRIFGMYAQIDATISRPRDGAGIGLTLVLRPAELRGGPVDAAGAGYGSRSAARSTR